MSNHLSHDQFAKCIVGEPARADRQHIAECQECSAELERFGNTLSRFRSAIRDRIDDRALNMSGIAPFPARRRETGSATWRWAVAVAALAVFFMLPFLVSKPAPQETNQPVLVESDANALMNRVNMDLSRIVPAPMEPMWALLPGDEPISESGGVQ